MIALAQLGASIKEDPRIARACTYLLDHGLAAGGQFSSLRTGDPSGTVDCLRGNLCWALVELGYPEARLQTAFEWMARSLTGEGVAPMEERQVQVRYYAGKCGPTFACGANNKLPCAWGGAKVMLAFSRMPGAYRSPLVERAIQHGVDFLFSVDPATALYPSGWSDKPSGNWWKKVSKNPKSLYGKLYAERKAMETAKNEAGDYKQQAADKLAKFKIGKTTDAYGHYSAGMLPPAHFHSRAKRWAVKLFLSHYFEQGYRLLYNQEPPVIYSIAMMGHIHKIEAENGSSSRPG